MILKEGEGRKEVVVKDESSQTGCWPTLLWRFLTFWRSGFSYEDEDEDEKEDENDQDEDQED